jgi:hypothetical protein
MDSREKAAPRENVIPRGAWSHTQFLANVEALPIALQQHRPLLPGSRQMTGLDMAKAAYLLWHASKGDGSVAVGRRSAWAAWHSMALRTPQPGRARAAFLTAAKGVQSGAAQKFQRCQQAQGRSHPGAEARFCSSPCRVAFGQQGRGQLVVQGEVAFKLRLHPGGKPGSLCRRATSYSSL